MHTIHELGRPLRRLLAAALLSPLPVAAQNAPAMASAVLRSGTLSFTGHATVGDFVGSTSEVTGLVEGGLADARGWVEAPVATLHTHNDLRDRDLRSSMEVGKYPVMRFDLAKATVVSPHDRAGDSVGVTLHGSLTIHGVTRVVDLPATLSFGGDSTHVTASFPLDLAVYRIGGLTKMFGLLRMQRQIEVRVDLLFVSQAPPVTTAGEP